MPLSDHEIESIKPLTPFVATKTKTLPDGTPCLSYGLSHYGYDICLSGEAEVLAFCPSRLDMIRQWLGQVLEFVGLESLGGRVMPPAMNPKGMDRRYLKPLKKYQDDSGRYVITPARACWLGVQAEHLTVPPNALVDCTGKSTYARAGMLVFPTPVEPGWTGYLTLEGLNTLPVRSRIYLDEGMVQLVFHTGEPCEQGYEGKYQDQQQSVTLAKV